MNKFRQQVELYQSVFALDVDVQPSLKSRKTAAGPSAAATNPRDGAMAVCHDGKFDVWSDSVWQEPTAADRTAVVVSSSDSTQHNMRQALADCGPAADRELML